LFGALGALGASCLWCRLGSVHTLAVAAPFVLHVLPVDLSRGAQTYARALRDALDGDHARHRTLTLFRSPPAALRADQPLGIEPGALRRMGLDPRALRSLRETLRADPPDVVVAHGGEPLKYAVLAGVPAARLVYYKIGIGGTRLAGTKRWLHRALLARAGVVAVVSEDAAAEARALGVGGPRLRVVPNGRDPAVYRRPGYAHERHDGAARLVFVGHLTASKRPERFLDLVSVLRAQGVAVEAAMAGDGPLLASMRSAGVDARVEVLGLVDDVPALFARSDLFVFTSVPEGEGMPGVLIEAGMAGLPVVTTDVPGASTVVVNGTTGFVVGVDDFNGLVDRTRTLVDDAELRRRAGAAAQVHCEAEFGLAASAQRWQRLVTEIVGDRCTSSI
jgi:glycosyltransferase involved in cell wall biosynthesis